ncbi:MAG: FHA domain-containing protein [Prevotella sp.]|nr:FHA domain-containing protein [Prevotella sp.]
MRCQFCGWDNPEGKTNCEKCNKPLLDEGNSEPVSAVSQGTHSKVTARQGASSFNPKATVRESAAFQSQPVQSVSCPECGFPLENGFCANCGFADKKVEPEKVKQEDNPRMTIRPKRKEPKEGSFTLTPISEENGMPEGDAIQFEGNEVSLNRNNTDPKNKTITSAEQAVVFCEDGKWSIKDKSELKTTFVQAEQAIELKSGSLILLGSQLYRFDG